MDGSGDTAIYAPATWYREGRGPRYLQLYRHLAAAISSGPSNPTPNSPRTGPGRHRRCQPRHSAQGRVQLVSDGLIEQRRGAGGFVRSAAPRLEQSLSRLTSFTEYMAARGLTSTSEILGRGLFPRSQTNPMALGIPAPQRVARIERLRFADGTPMAIERSSLPPRHPAQSRTGDDLALHRAARPRPRPRPRDPAHHRREPRRPESRLLNLPEGAAVLRIDRTGYLASGRPVEFTRGLYRSDIYDFVAELRLDGS